MASNTVPSSDAQTVHRQIHEIRTRNAVRHEMPHVLPMHAIRNNSYARADIALNPESGLQEPDNLSTFIRQMRHLTLFLASWRREQSALIENLTDRVKLLRSTCNLAKTHPMCHLIM